MRIKMIIAGLCFALFAQSGQAQSNLHIPKEIQQAYKNGTRSKDGKPGPKYWQNFVEYKIDVTVTPETRGIDGKETVIFKNNSPNDLSSVVIRLYYDVFKKGNERGMQVNEEDIGEGTDIKSVSVNGTAYDLKDQKLTRRQGTNMVINLPAPLKTGESVTLGIEWGQKVPLTVRRTGAIDSTSFFVAYWYPQVSVYDDVFGWDGINYTFETEFYNNLANFDVNITAPDNFLVWATGTLENSAAILPADIHKKYAQAKTSTEVVNVVTPDELKSLKLKSGTWHYKANEVSDFAFAISDHYAWDATSQKVSGKDVLIGTAYPAAQAARYTEVTKIQQKTMKHFSEDVPGIPYPYPAFTTYIGLRGGGMEFPMMANNDGPGRGVTIHEMFHTYFPMYVRINERRFAWMDEGWADFATALVTDKYFKKEGDQSSFYGNLKPGMQGMIGTIGDLPTVTSSQYMGNNYGYHSYSLPSFTYALLYQHLGEEKFLKAWREYITRWAKKSPTPYDFFYTFENVSGEDLSWLWNSWYFQMGYPDVAIQSFDKGKLVVKRIGDRPIPVSVYVEYENVKEGKPQEFRTVVSSSVWKNNNRQYTVDIPNASQVKTLTLNADFPDFNEIDNYFPTLAERFKKFNFNKDILGRYAAKEFPVDVILSMEEGVLMMEITNAGISAFMLPKDATTFESTDGAMILTYEKKEGSEGIKLQLKNFGVTLTGAKK